MVQLFRDSSVSLIGLSHLIVSKMSKRLLNVQHNSTQARIDTKDMDDISQVQGKVLVAFCKNSTMEQDCCSTIHFDDLDDIKALTKQYYWKPKKSGFSVSRCSSVLSSISSFC
jgi:hypothetical protein